MDDKNESSVKKLRKDSIYIEVSQNFIYPAYTHTPLLSSASNYVALDRTHLKLSPTRMGGCISDSLISTKLCNSVAWADGFRTFCNCTEIGYISREEIFHSVRRNVCTPLASIHCYRKIMDQHSLMVEKNCQKPNCLEETFTISLTTGEINQDYVRIRTNTTDNSIEYTKVYIYYQTLRYLSFDEYQSMSFDSVLSAVGGNIGLFLGGSLISVVQVATSLLLNLKNFIRKLTVNK